MIRHFILLSLLLHGLLAVLPVAGFERPLSWPAPELSVSLRGAAAAPAAGSGPPVATADARRSNDALSSNPSPVQSARTADFSAVPADTGRAGDHRAQEHRLTNHLQSQLRIELQTHFVYPPLARRQGWQGRVQVALQIEADGRLSELQVLRSSGHSVLDADAVHTLQRIGQLPLVRGWLSGRARRVEFPVVYRLLEG